MVTITEPAAFVLDADTAQQITRLSHLWNVSRDEALRRSVSEAVKQAALKEPAQMSPSEALAKLQALACLTKEQAEAWKNDIRQGWDEAFERRERDWTTRDRA